MARNLKLNIKNTQLAEAFKLSSLKPRSGLTGAKKTDPAAKAPDPVSPKEIERVEDSAAGVSTTPSSADAGLTVVSAPKQEPALPSPEKKIERTGSVTSRPLVKGAELNVSTPVFPKKPTVSPAKSTSNDKETVVRPSPPASNEPVIRSTRVMTPSARAKAEGHLAKNSAVTNGQNRSTTGSRRAPPKLPPGFKTKTEAPVQGDGGQAQPVSSRTKLGPTGRHIDDFITAQTADKPAVKGVETVQTAAPTQVIEKTNREGPEESKAKKPGKGKESGKHQRKASSLKSIESYLKGGVQERTWRKPRQKASKSQAPPQSAVPPLLTIRLPISVKDLASEMKLKASQLIAQLFMQGITLTLNDLIEDDTLVAVLGSHFKCEITVDTSREDRLAVTDKSVDQEIAQSDVGDLINRAPVVTFMGHVDHGKTSLVDAIRQTNRAAHEAGAITQHIGAFTASSAHGPITILDTPGHAAFSEMRARGAKITDLVVLVIAGDEGIKDQTKEVIEQARAANAVLLVAINKSDKEAFDVEKVYRQLAEIQLLPEAWGGTTITVNCSAKSGKGVDDLLEMIGLQAELLELKANPTSRARGVVVEVQMHKGLGPLATVLVQNGTLRKGDSLVFEDESGRVRNMRDEKGKEVDAAGPSTPVAITGLSGLPKAGEQFICVVSEKEAREITEGRRLAGVARSAHKRRIVSDAIFAPGGGAKKVINLVVRADVNGSLEAVKTAIDQIHSDKIETNIIADGVGEVSESDVLLAAASKAIVIGFHTQIESHAEILIKQRGVNVQMFDLIYHLVDGVRVLMTGMLDKIKQEDKRGTAEVRELFRSSRLGLIAGCIVSEGSIHRNHQLRVLRDGQVLHRGTIASIKRGKEDVREVTKGLECGILPSNISDLQAGDILEAIEVSYLAQEL